MAQWSSLYTFTKDSSSVPSNHIRKLIALYTSSSRRSGVSGLYGHLNLCKPTHNPIHNFKKENLFSKAERGHWEDQSVKIFTLET